MTDEKEKKEGEACEEQGEAKDVQDQVPLMWPSPFFRRRHFGSEGPAYMREVWRYPVGAREMADVAVPPRSSDALGYEVGIEFRREYMGRFPEQMAEEIIAEGLWAQYHLACEEFDQAVCSGRRRGVAVPSEGYEYSMIARHAAGRRRYLVEKARSMGISKDQLAVSAEVVNRELMSSWNYLVKETMMAMIQRMNDLLYSDRP